MTGTRLAVRTSGRVACILALLLTGPELHAEPSHDRLAQSLKDEGDAAMAERRFEDALTAYRNAASVEPSSALDYNCARALQGLGRQVEALEHLEKFEAEAAPELKARVPQLAALLTTLRASVGSLDVTSSVAGAVLRVGALPDMSLPLARPLRLKPGPVEVRVEARGYVTVKQLVSVRAGEVLRMPVRLRRVDRLATLRVDSNAPGARLSIDGQAAGQVPIEILLEPGTHALRLEHSGYQPHQSRIVAIEKERRALRIHLESRPAFYSYWWFWAGVGVVTTTAAVTLIALHTDSSPDRGDIPPGRLSAPLLSF